MIPVVEAIELGTAQTAIVSAIVGVVGLRYRFYIRSGSSLENYAIDGESPVHVFI